MSRISNLASDIGWEDGWEIPVANTENKQLTAQLSDDRKERDRLVGDIETGGVKIKHLQSHLKAVRDELTNTLNMRNNRKKDIDHEKHMTVIADRERGRLQQQNRQMDKHLEEQREKRNSYENKLYVINNKTEELKSQMQWDQHALEAWLEESARRDEDALVIQKFSRQDESKTKELQLLIEKLTEESAKARKNLENETTETLTAQIELDKTAEEFRAAHLERQELINQWETTIDQMKRRDDEIVHEEQKLEEQKDEVVARQQIIKEKRAFLDTEAENNIELEKKIEIRERQNGKLREKKQMFEERVQLMADDVTTLQYRGERARKDNDFLLNQIEEQKIKMEKLQTKLSSLQDEKRGLSDQITRQKKGLVSAADASKNAEVLLDAEEAKIKDLESVRRRARDIAFKKSQELKKQTEAEKNVLAECHGGGIAIRNLRARLHQLDQESLKNQEIIYQQDFNIAQLERRIARMQGDVNNDEKQALEEKIEQLNQEQQDRLKTKKILDEQLRKLQDNLRRVNRETEKCEHEHEGLNSKIEELELYDDSSQRELKNLVKEKQSLMVEDNILKLEVKRIRDNLHVRADDVMDLNQRKLRLSTALKERQSEILQHQGKLNQELKHAGEVKSQLNMEVQSRIAKIDKLKKRFEILTVSMQGPEGEEQHSQAFHVIKAAQEKEQLQRQGDELHAKIQKAEREIDGLENTLRIVNAGNDRLRKSLKKVGDDDEELYAMNELENSRRVVFDTLRYKREILKELGHDLELLESGLLEARTQEEATNAELAARKANAIQLQKELDQHSEKVLRVNKQITRLEKEMASKHPAISESRKREIKLKSLREVSRGCLRSIANLKDNQPQMAPHIEQMVSQVGLRLPTPSQLLSPASSARSLTSSTGSNRSFPSRSGPSRQSQSRQSHTSTRSGTTPAAVVIGMSSELPSPPGSVNSEWSNRSSRSNKSARSNASSQKSAKKDFA